MQVDWIINEEYWTIIYKICACLLVKVIVYLRHQSISRNLFWNICYKNIGPKAIWTEARSLHYGYYISMFSILATVSRLASKRRSAPRTARSSTTRCTRSTACPTTTTATTASLCPTPSTGPWPSARTFSSGSTYRTVWRTASLASWRLKVLSIYAYWFFFRLFQDWPLFWKWCMSVHQLLRNTIFVSWYKNLSDHGYRANNDSEIIVIFTLDETTLENNNSLLEQDPPKWR